MDSIKFTIEKFDGEGFEVWKHRMVNFFKKSKVWDVVNGTTTDSSGKARAPKPEEIIDVDFALDQSLSSRVLLQIMDQKSPREKWKKLCTIYEQDSDDMRQRLAMEFFTLRIEDGEDITNFVSRASRLVTRLNGMGEDYKDSMVIANILAKLPEEYDIFRVSWGGRATNKRTLSNLISSLLQEEQRLKEKNPASSATAFHLQGKIQSKKNNGKWCSFHKCNSHNTNECNAKKKANKNNSNNRGPFCRKPNNNKGSKGSNQNDDKGDNTPFPATHALVASVMSARSTDRTNSISWIADSGASSHVCPVRHWFTDFTPRDGYLNTANGQCAPIKGIGKVTVMSQGHPMVINDVLYAPSITHCLFSLCSTTNQGNSVHFEGNKCLIRYKGRLVAEGIKTTPLYVMSFRQFDDSANLVRQPVTLETWHHRLGHINIEKVVKAINFKDPIPDHIVCQPCIHGKAHRLPFPKGDRNRQSAPGSLIHADLCGPFKVPSVSGAKYFLLFKDDYSGLMFVYFLQEKTQTHKFFRQFLLDWKQVTKLNNPSIIRTDHGTEFKGEFEKFLQSNGIAHQFSTAYAPEQNGFIERSMRTVTESARTMLHETQLKPYLWAEAVNTAVFTLNRVPYLTGTQSPLELASGSVPDLNSLRIFGSKAYKHVEKQSRRKWDSKVREMIHVGYEAGCKAYRLWDPSSRKLVIARDVTIVEPVLTDFIHFESRLRPLDSESNRPSDSEEAQPQGGSQEREEANRSQETIPHLSLLPAASVVPEEEEPVPSSTTDRTTRSQIGLIPRQDYREARPYVKSSSSKETAALAFMLVEEPLTFKHALESNECNQWKKAMDDEMKSLLENSTWTLVKRDPKDNVIKNKWVFRKKLNADGTIDRFKARLVAKGYTQQPGIDYDETFAPVVRYDTVRILLSIAVDRDMDLTQFDVKTAFLYGDLSERILMEQPEGYQSSDGTMVCLLNKSLYGLKQAPRAWNDKFKSVLHSFGLEQSRHDPCLFVSKEKDLFLALYVDDGLIITKNTKLRDNLIAVLKKNFAVTIGDSTTFVGLQIKRNKEGIFIHQSSYCQKVIERFGMADCAPVSSPVDPKVKLRKSDAGPLNVPFRELIGSLMYLAVISRPDIAYIVSTLSQYLSNPDQNHWTAAKRVLRYLKGTTSLGIQYSKSGSNLVAYSDSDFCGDIDTRRSRSGVILILNNGPVLWTSKRQAGVTLSSCEAELTAATNATTSVLWTQFLLHDLGMTNIFPTLLMVDNQSAIRLIKNPEFHHKTKHIDVKNKFVREKYEEGILDVNYIPTHQQLADILTKGLSTQTHLSLVNYLNLTTR